MKFASDEIRDKHEKMLYTAVRVRGERGVGSGTVIYCGLVPGEENEYETYVLTNHHVIEDNIKVGKEWSNLLQRDVKKDILNDADVEFFNFEYGSWEGGHSGHRAVIVAYDKPADIALLKLKKSTETKYVAQLFPKGQEKKRLRIFMKCYAVGCGLGHPPIATEGHLNCFTDTIENYPYWMQSGPIIFGNSGGAVFLDETYEYLGIPSRVAISGGGFVADAITHMSYFIPITTLYKFLEENIHQFIYDKEFDSKKCAEIRKHRRERDERLMVGDMSKEEGSRSSCEGCK